FGRGATGFSERQGGRRRRTRLPVNGRATLGFGSGRMDRRFVTTTRRPLVLKVHHRWLIARPRRSPLRPGQRQRIYGPRRRSDRAWAAAGNRERRQLGRFVQRRISRLLVRWP